MKLTFLFWMCVLFRVGKCIFLLRGGEVTQFKRSTLKQHHETRHPTLSAESPEGGELRAKNRQKLKQHRKNASTSVCVKVQQGLFGV